MAKFRKIKISNKSPEKRVGAAFVLMGIVGLYAFLLHVWAGNSPDLPALAAILLLIVVGLGMHRRAKGAPPPPKPKPSAKPTFRLPALFKRKAKAEKSAEEEPPPPPPPPKKKGLAALFKLPGRKK